MSNSIALNLRKKVRAIQREADYVSPMGRCIVIEEEAFVKGSTQIRSYIITAAYRKDPDRRRPLASVDIEWKGIIGLGYYKIVDNSRHCWEEFIDWAPTYPYADHMAYDRARKIARWFKKMTGMPVVNHTIRGGQMDVSVDEKIKRAVELAARS